MIKRIIFLTLALQFSIATSAAISSPEKQEYLKIAATTGVAKGAQIAEMEGALTHSAIQHFEELGGFQVESFSDIRDLAFTNEIAAESKYPTRLLFAAQIVRVARENGDPVAYINSINEEKTGPEVTVRLTANSLSIAGTLRQGDHVTLLCNELNVDGYFLMDGCEFPGSFYSTIIDHKQAREIFIRECNKTDSVSMSDAFIIFVNESASAREILKQFTANVVGNSRFQKTGLGLFGEFGSLLENEQFKEFRSNNPDAFGRDDPDGDKEEYCENLI